MAQSVQQIRFCTSRDGTRIAYATCGSGPPLVWATRFMSHLKLEWESPIWGPWISLLARRHTLIRYDGRGFGLSDRDGIEFALTKFLEDLEAVVEAARVDRFVLVAFSSGGATAMTYALRHPERVSHLVLSGCYTRGRIARAMTPEQVEEAEATIRLTELGWSNENPSFGQLHTSHWIPDSTTEQVHLFNELIRQSTTGANAASHMRTVFALDLRQTAQQIRCPTLVLHVREDAAAPFDEGRTLAGLIPGARFVPLESRNHLLLENEPAWQQFVEVLDDFLAPPSPAKLPRAQNSFLDDLTAREHQVLELLAQGLDNDTIAGRLGISEKTVRNQVSTIFSKLGVNSRAQAVVRARDAGLGYKASD